MTDASDEVELRARLTDEPIDVASVIGWVDRPAAGAIDLFLGVVRDHADGRAVTLLEYEAYRPMAQRELVACIEEIETAMPTVKLAVVHRLGSLAVGQVAVVCAASSPHRHEAFVACRRLIDSIKSRVPIWKREHGPYGVVWVGWEDARCGMDHAHEHAHEHAK